MSEMAINKVVFGDKTLIDLSEDTVTAAVLRTGFTAHGADGKKIVGTYAGGPGSGGDEIDDILLHGFSVGNVEIADRGNVITFTEKSTGQVLTKTISDDKAEIVTVLKDSEDTELGRLTTNFVGNRVMYENTHAGTITIVDISDTVITRTVKDSATDDTISSLTQRYI